MHRKHEATQTVAVFRLWEDFCQQDFCRAGGENARRSYSTRRKKQMERKKYGKKENPQSERLFLHAYQIEFEHPVTKEKCLFTAPLPKVFAEKRKGMEE